MKKGSKAVRCCMCNKVVGYLEPGEPNVLGTTGSELRLFKGCFFGVKYKNHDPKYYCERCKVRNL